MSSTSGSTPSGVWARTLASTSGFEKIGTVRSVFTKELQAYAFLQLPLYQYVNGVQLTASKSAVIGVSMKF